MKEVIVTSILVITLVTSAFAQQDDKVNVAFSPEELAEKAPEEIAYLRFKSSECYQVQDLSGKKDIGELADISVLNEKARVTGVQPIDASVFEKSQFNPLLYDANQTQPDYYRIGDSGVVLKILSENRCRELFNK